MPSELLGLRCENAENSSSRIVREARKRVGCQKAPPWSAPPCRRFGRRRLGATWFATSQFKQAATESPQSKAPTTGVPGAAAALGWRGGALQSEAFGVDPIVIGA